MKRSISALKSRRRVRLAVDVLEDRQLLSTITVNTTADQTAANSSLSLREAIEVSNGTLAVSSLSTQAQAQVSGAVESTNTIDFNIPTTDPGYDATTGVWTIALGSGLPVISTNAAIIDGYSQPGAAENMKERGDNAKLAIAISGTGAGTIVGLTIGQAGSEVRARRRELRLCRNPRHGRGQRSSLGLLHRHGPLGRDRRPQRHGIDHPELGQSDRRTECRRSQRDLRQFRLWHPHPRPVR